jgi:outer membrane protein assembly factor BamB
MLTADGTLAWRFRTGGIIDAAGAIGRYEKALRSAPVTIGSGDERLYRLRTNRHLSRKRRIVWAFAPTLPPVGGQQVSWWEGNVAIGPGGTIYAGNTGGAAYAINPDGTLRWAAPRGQSVWTTPAFGQGTEAGNTFWGPWTSMPSRSTRPGIPRWQTFTPATSPRRPRSAPTGRSTSVPSTTSSTRSTRTLDRSGGASPPTHIYSSPALADGSDAAPRDLHRLGGRVGLRVGPIRAPALAL